MKTKIALAKDEHGGYVLTVDQRNAIIFRIDNRTGWCAFERDADGNQIASTVYDFRRKPLIEQMIRDLSSNVDDSDPYSWKWRI